MGKKVTRAEAILQGVRDRVEAARRDVERADEELTRAQSVRDTKVAILAALVVEHNEMSKALAPVKRKVADPKPASAQNAEKKSKQRSLTVAPPVNSGTEKETVLSAVGSGGGAA